VHRARVPSRAGPHPTVVMLHGLGGDGSAMWLLWPALPRDWLAVAPQATIPEPGGGYAWRHRERDEWPTLEAFDDAVHRIGRFVSCLPQLYGADADAIFLMGFSQGAAAAFATTMRLPGTARAVASVVGFVPSDCAASDLVDLRDLPVFMAAGTRDRLVGIGRSRACARALEAAGALLDYREYDVGHKLSLQGSRDLRQWFEITHADRGDAVVDGPPGSAR